MYDFANILFAGACNRACPWCIGRTLPAAVNRPNLDLWPPRGLEAFIAEVDRHRIEQVVFTGTITDPQLYRHEARLLALLRERLHPAARFSVHTNGVLALRKLDVFNAYDRACISFPSFDPATYRAMMGPGKVPDLAAILAAARIPVKVSCVVDENNVAEIPAFVAECRRIGVRRLVVRKLHGETRDWGLFRDLEPTGWFRGNPVYTVDGMELTHWDFDRSRCTSINLYPDGSLGRDYLLTEGARTAAREYPVDA
jgi:MoaA/NifB/PqqE/SkfB family radical SAM enzyme